MNYRQAAPGASASRFVECYWTLEDDNPSPAAVQRIVPDGTCELIINLGQPFQHFDGGHWSTQPEVFVSGQITGPLLLRPSGPFKMLGVRFHPHGPSSLLRVEMDELTNSFLPLGDLSSDLAREVDRVRGQPNLAAIDRVLQKLAGKSTVPDTLVTAAVQHIVLAGGTLDLCKLAAHLGISLRQLERRFKSAVGLAPKLFCRMQRFQRVFRAIEYDGRNWVDAAVECGYFDQAHLIRDFNFFSGKTPSALLAETDLARHFLRYPDGVSHFSKTAGPLSM